jgi:hypothetical protein
MEPKGTDKEKKEGGDLSRQGESPQVEELDEGGLEGVSGGTLEATEPAFGGSGCDCGCS